MKILNWNTEFVSPRARANKFQMICETIAKQEADIVCLTEAYPESLPSGGQTVKSEVSGPGSAERGGARKVVLWSRTGWSDVDRIGSPNLPEGRFISATTKSDGKDWHIVGMCIPYFGYRIKKEIWGNEALSPWQGANMYLEALRSEVLRRDRFLRRTILLGDFNLHIPPGKSSRQPKAVSQLCEMTFADWMIPTAGEIEDPALDKRFIDHIALTADITVESMRFISRFAEDGTRLSDHNGVCIKIVPKID